MMMMTRPLPSTLTCIVSSSLKWQRWINVCSCDSFIPKGLKRQLDFISKPRRPTALNLITYKLPYVARLKSLGVHAWRTLLTFEMLNFMVKTEINTLCAVANISTQTDSLAKLDHTFGGESITTESFSSWHTLCNYCCELIVVIHWRKWKLNIMILIIGFCCPASLWMDLSGRNMLINYS